MTLIDNVIAQVREDIEQRRISVRLMEEGKLSLHSHEGAGFVDKTAECIARDKLAIAKMEALLARHPERGE